MGKILLFHIFNFLCYFKICVMRYYSASTGSPLLHWVLTIFHQNYWQKYKVYIFRKQAFHRFCIWNCELIIQDVKYIIYTYIRKRERDPNLGGQLVFRGGYLSCLSWNFGSNQKSHPKQRFWQIFHTLKLGFFEFGKLSYPNQGYGFKIIP